MTQQTGPTGPPSAGDQTAGGTLVQLRPGEALAAAMAMAICALSCAIVWYSAAHDSAAAAIAAAAVGGVLAGAANLIARRRLLRGVARVGTVLDRLLSGEIDTELAAGAGELAVLQERVRRLARAHFALLKEQLSLRDEVMKARADAIEQMAARFEREASAAIGEVTGTARELEILANDLDTSTSRLEKEAGQALADAEGSACGADTAAASTAELASAVQDLTGQIMRAASGTASIATRTEEARTLFSELASTITEIGEVSKLIGGIAGQTNLLALNASIEAARAGEAGRGFAVVAGEVKTLAGQTARATTDIADRIGGIQRQAGAARVAVEQIADAVKEVDAIAAAIAAGMAEQSTGVGQIARAAAEASDGARRAMGRVGAATEEIYNNRMSVAQIHAAAAAVFNALHELEGQVAGFVKTAVGEAGRRRSRRFEVAVPCHIIVQGRRFEGTMLDVSAGGARLQAPVRLAPGDTGTLDAAGLPQAHFRVVSQASDIQVAFIFDAGADRTRMHDAVLGLVARLEAAA